MASINFDTVNSARFTRGIKAPCVVASTGNLTLSGFQTIDGTTFTSTFPSLRVLVKDQTDATENGIYELSSGVWRRTIDFDSNRELATGTIVYVHSGTEGAGEYRLTTADPVTIDSSEIDFSALGGGDLPVSSTDNAIARYNGTSGDLQNSGVLIDDSDNITLAGALQCVDNIVSRPKIIDYGLTVNAIGSIGGGTQDIDLTSGNVVSATVDTSETTFTFSNPPASGTEGKFTLYLTNGGSQTVNWPASVDWADGSVPALTVSGRDVLVFSTIDGGTIWDGFAVGLDMQ